MSLTYLPFGRYSMIPLFPIERIFPERDTGTIEVEDKGDDLSEDVFVDTNPPSSLYTTGQF